MVTKKQLGVFVLTVDGLFIVALVVTDRVGAGQWSGFGPLQQIGLGLGLVAAVVGGVLVRLGDRPA